MTAGRAIWGLVAWLCLALPLAAQGFTALARIDPDASRISAAPDGGVDIRLGLQIGVPYRIFTLDDPQRLVMDFREVDWTGLSDTALVQTDRVTSVQFGAYVPGWSRMVARLAAPMEVATATMTIDPETAAARLSVGLRPVTAQAFAEQAGAPHDPQWDLPAPQQVAPARIRDADAPLVVVLDPGHGGIDPGAEVDDLEEKDLMLRFARELREVLLRAGGFQVVMTREDDHFVSLERRVSMAHQNGADVFISLHADSLAEGQAHGATVHVLSREASDAASAKLAERHDREDLLSGVDLSDADDEVTDILLDLARQETQPRTEALARAVVDAIAASGGPMNRRPLRRASFSVLKAADIPSILIEIGFMSSPRDLKNLRDPAWRVHMAQAIRAGLEGWRRADRAQKPLVRH